MTDIFYPIKTTTDQDGRIIDITIHNPTNETIKIPLLQVLNESIRKSLQDCADKMWKDYLDHYYKQLAEIETQQLRKLAVINNPLFTPKS